MAIEIPSNAVVAFDLDDTLYNEIDFVQSGFRAVAQRLQTTVGSDLYDELIDCYAQGERRVFQAVLARHQLRSPAAEELLQLYQYLYIPRVLALKNQYQRRNLI